MSGDHQFAVTERFDPHAMQALMRHDSIYWSASDALAPQPEQMDFVSHLLHPDTCTFAATYNGHVVGYVKFMRRTTVMAEMHTGFLPHFRGKFAKAAIESCIYRMFTEKGLTKIVGIVPADNRATIRLIGLIGFRREGRLRSAIVRRDGLTDLVIMSLDKTRMN